MTTQKTPLEEIQDFITDRANNRVVAAQAITHTSINDGTLTATFSPESVGLTPQQFEELVPFDNLSHFIGVPLSFNNDQGARLREHITQVTTQYQDGTPLGSATTAELYKLATGDTPGHN